MCGVGPHAGWGGARACARGRRPLQAASSPVWVGHDDMMISFKIARVSRSRNFAVRASILAALNSTHGQLLWESSSQFLGSIPLGKALPLISARDSRIDEDESFITVDDEKSK